MTNMEASVCGTLEDLVEGVFEHGALVRRRAEPVEGVGEWEAASLASTEIFHVTEEVDTAHDVGERNEQGFVGLYGRCSKKLLWKGRLA